MVKILFICHVCASFSSVAQTTTTEPAQSLLIFSEDRNIFQPLSRVPEIPTSLFTAAQFLRSGVKI